MNYRVAFLLLSLLLASCSKPKDGIKNFVPSSQIARVAVNGEITSSLESIWTFTRVGKRIFTLDWHGRGVDEIAFDGRTWRAVSRFSRNGNGPGEITEPVSLAFDERLNRITIGERSGELESFDTAGNYLSSQTMNLPCVAARVQYVTARTTVLVGQRCFGGRFAALSADTAYALLATVSSGQPKILTYHATSNRRGDWGTIFTVEAPVAVGIDSIFFASGATDCIERAAIDRVTSLRKQCTAMQHYRAKKPAGFGKKQNAAIAMKWPDPLPSFLWLFALGDRPVLVRPISSDSVSFAFESAPDDFFLVAPLNSLVDCNKSGCLWFDNSADPQRVAILTSDSIESLAKRRRRGHD